MYIYMCVYWCFNVRILCCLSPFPWICTVAAHSWGHVTRLFQPAEKPAPGGRESNWDGLYWFLFWLYLTDQLSWVIDCSILFNMNYNPLPIVTSQHFFSAVEGTVCLDAFGCPWVGDINRSHHGPASLVRTWYSLRCFTLCAFALLCSIASRRSHDIYIIYI